MISLQGHDGCNEFDSIDVSMDVVVQMHIDVECVNLNFELELEFKTVKVLVKHVLYETHSL